MLLHFHLKFPNSKIKTTKTQLVAVENRKKGIEYFYSIILFAFKNVTCVVLYIFKLKTEHTKSENIYILHKKDFFHLIFNFYELLKCARRICPLKILNLNVQCRTCLIPNKYCVYKIINIWKSLYRFSLEDT